MSNLSTWIAPKPPTKPAVGRKVQKLRMAEPVEDERKKVPLQFGKLAP